MKIVEEKAFYIIEYISKFVEIIIYKLILQCFQKKDNSEKRKFHLYRGIKIVFFWAKIAFSCAQSEKWMG